MRKVKVIVEHADCGFSAYMADSGLDYSCIGEGTSTEETVEDFKRSYEGMRDYFKETGRPFEEVEFVEICRNKEVFSGGGLATSGGGLVIHRNYGVTFRRIVNHSGT